MPLKSALVDTRAFDASMKKLAQRMNPTFFDSWVRDLCWKIIGQAIRSPVPSDKGELSRSGSVQRVRPGVYQFGFNCEYASFQDYPGKPVGSIIEIRPVRKKWLYVPLTVRGRRQHVYGGNPETEGLVYGEDYTLKRFVRIRIKPYGHKFGPNKYFSQTVKLAGPTIKAAIAELLKNAKGKAEGAARPYRWRNPSARNRALRYMERKYKGGAFRRYTYKSRKGVK